MKQVDQKTFAVSIAAGDVGVIRAKNFFATLQNWFRQKFNEGPNQASHGFFCKTPPEISEANGMIINGSATFLKDTGDSTEAWFFRYTKLTPEQLDDMLVFCLGAEETGGHYSVGGILQFAKAFVTGSRKMSDEGGVFCTEYTSDVISAGGIVADYITNLKSWMIDPSTQLNWFLSEEAAAKGWILAGHYDGKGGYFVADIPDRV